MESTAAQIIVSIIPIVGIACGSVLLFFALLWHHKETKQRINSGAPAPAKFNFKPFCLLTGLTLIGVGLVLSIMLFLLEGVCWALLGGLLPLAIGVAVCIFYKINPDFKKENEA
ncbi:MAG: hypothetical protein J1F14_00785 [Treponema sp.]|nr:hypothetical protein [Treponema sp.]